MVHDSAFRQFCRAILGDGYCALYDRGTYGVSAPCARVGPRVTSHRFGGSLINVNVVLTGGAAPGQAGAGIGISADSLPGQTAHAAVTAALILAPLWLALRRLRRDEAAVAD